MEQNIVITDSPKINRRGETTLFKVVRAVAVGTALFFLLLSIFFLLFFAYLNPVQYSVTSNLYNVLTSELYFKTFYIIGLVFAISFELIIIIKIFFSKYYYKFNKFLRIFTLILISLVISIILIFTFSIKREFQAWSNYDSFFSSFKNRTFDRDSTSYLHVLFRMSFDVRNSNLSSSVQTITDKMIKYGFKINENNSTKNYLKIVNGSESNNSFNLNFVNENKNYENSGTLNISFVKDSNNIWHVRSECIDLYFINIDQP